MAREEFLQLGNFVRLYIYQVEKRVMRDVALRTKLGLFPPPLQLVTDYRILFGFRPLKDRLGLTWSFRQDRTVYRYLLITILTVDVLHCHQGGGGQILSGSVVAS